MPRYKPGYHATTIHSGDWPQDEVTGPWLRWISRNPLKVWRVKADHSQSTVALRTGHSPSAIQKWEQGHGRPPRQFFEALERGNPEQWQRKWDKWLRQRPAIRRVA